MRKILITTVSVMIPALFLLGFVIITHPSWADVSAQTTGNYSESYAAHLTGSEQVPSVATSGNGAALFNAVTDSSSIDYQIQVSNLQAGISGVQLNCAAADHNGPIIVDLLASSTESSHSTSIASSSTMTMGTTSTLITGRITQESIIPAAMTCNPTIQTLSHVIQAMREGEIYVNVQTTAFPHGEIRGQIMRLGNVNNTWLWPWSISTTTPQTSIASLSTNSQTTTTPDTTITTSSTSSTPTSDNATSTITSTDTTVVSTSTPSSVTAASGIYYVMVTPDAYSKNPGSSVVFNGSHFYPNEIVTIQSNGQTLGTISVNGEGTFSTGSFPVPNIRGNKVYTFTGSVSAISFPVTITISGSNPWLILSTYYAGAGTPITISGHGFGSNEPVSVTFAGNNVGTVQASENGDFNLTTTVLGSGVHTDLIRAVGLHTGSTVEASFSQAF